MKGISIWRRINKGVRRPVQGDKACPAYKADLKMRIVWNKCNEMIAVAVHLYLGFLSRLAMLIGVLGAVEFLHCGSVLSMLYETTLNCQLARRHYATPSSTPFKYLN